MKDKHSHRNVEVVFTSERGGYQDSKKRKWVKEIKRERERSKDKLICVHTPTYALR